MNGLENRAISAADIQNLLFFEVLWVKEGDPIVLGRSREISKGIFLVGSKQLRGGRVLKGVRLDVYLILIYGRGLHSGAKDYYKLFKSKNYQALNYY